MQSNPNDNQHQQMGLIIQDHERRLMGLQVSLQNSFRSGELSQAQYSVRAESLMSHLRTIRNLGTWHDAESVALTQESNLGLPNLNQCSPEEREVCLRFLRERHKLLEQLLSTATRIYGWIVDASRGKGWSWTLTWRLSKMKRLLQKYDNCLNGLKFDNDEQDKLLARLAKAISPKQTAYAQDNLDALITLFNNLDYAAAKVAHLKASLRKEEFTITRMEHWLKQYENRLVNQAALQPPPATPLAKDVLEQNHTISSPLLNTERKLTLVRSYIEDHLHTHASRLSGRGVTR